MYISIIHVQYTMIHVRVYICMYVHRWLMEQSYFRNFDSNNNLYVHMYCRYICMYIHTRTCTYISYCTVQSTRRREE